MSTPYLIISFSNLLLGGGYAPPPHTIYIPYPIPGTPMVLGTSFLDWAGGVIISYEIHDTWLGVGLPIRMRYRTYYSGGAGSFYHADLATSENADFRAAVEAGNLTGSYVDDDGVTWYITHVNHSSSIVLPGGIGGGEDDYPTVFTEPTPIVQAGGEPGAKVTTPTPNDGVTGVSVNLAELDWAAG